MTYIELKETIKDIDGWFFAGSFALKELTIAEWEANDIDIFFVTQEAYNDAKIKMLEVATLNYSSEYSDTFDSIQLIHHIFGSPEEILESFDLNICRVAIYKDEFIDLRQTDEILILNPQNYLLLDRILKYSFRGYEVSLETIKLAQKLMTSDELSEIPYYGGRAKHMKYSTQQFMNAIYINMRIVFKELYKNYNFLEEMMNQESIGLLFSTSKYIYNYTTETEINPSHRFAYLFYLGELVRDELTQAKELYPESFI